ncbi:MAG: glycosyltransferase family 2 protein [Actinomycetes bacterium]
MSEDTPRVGVVIPVFNVERWLDATLASLRRQTYPNWSAIIVDDESTDGTVSVAERHAAVESRIRVVTNPERGPGARLSRILGRSLHGNSVDYLYFPDGDDVLDPRLIAMFVERLEARPDAVAAYCRYLTIDESDTVLSTSTHRRFALTPHWSRTLDDADPVTPFETLYAGAGTWEGLTMFKRTAYDTAGGLDESPAWTSHTVLDLLLRMTPLGEVIFVPEPLYHRRRRAGMVSENVARTSANDRELRLRWRARGQDDPALGAFVARSDLLLRHRKRPRGHLEQAWTHLRRGRLVLVPRLLVLAALKYRWRRL